MRTFTLLAILGAMAPYALAGIPSTHRGAVLAAQDAKRTTKVSVPAVQPNEDARKSVILQLSNPLLVDHLSSLAGTQGYRPLKSGGGVYEFQFKNSGVARSGAEFLRTFPEVKWAYQNSGYPQVRDQFVPTDPFYNAGNPAAEWPGQWYLNNTFTAGLDIQVVPAWNLDWTGLGVIMAVVDDGLQVNHPDLATNVSVPNSFNFGNNTGTPTPATSLDNHGTAVAGLIAARGGNAAGITGVAPRATLGGLRIDFENGAQFETQNIDATRYRSIAGSAFIRVKNHSYGPTLAYTNSAAVAQAIRDSAATGTIHVRSAGNSRGSSSEDTTKFLERGIPETIVVSGLGSDGLFYTSGAFGASLTCVAPTSPVSEPFLSMITTDRTTESAGYNGGLDTFPNPDYTSRFGATSGAAPLVSGAMTLLVQKRPSANVRYAKHLLARSSKRVDLTDSTATSDGGWRQNAAGIWFNPNYGFGLVQVGDMLNLADEYSEAGPLSVETSAVQSVGAAIPDNSSTGVTRTVTLTQPGNIEELSVSLNITHAFRGDLEAFVTSPSGTTRRLFVQAGSDGTADINWKFMSNAFWGEPAAGVWSVQVRDMASLDAGTWNTVQLEARTGNLLFAPTTLSGKIDFGPSGYTGTVSTVTGVVELADLSDNVVETAPLVLDGAGNFSITTRLRGNHKVFVKPSHWLRKLCGTVNLTKNPSAVGTHIVLNGDITTDDNSVDLLDYFALSDSYNLVLGDSGFNSMADLNGDDSVDLLDYFILSDNYNLVGD